MKQNAALRIPLNKLSYFMEGVFEYFFKISTEIEIVGERMIFKFDRTIVEEKDVDLMMFTILNVIEDTEVLEDVIMFSITLYQLESFFKRYTNLENFSIIVSESCSFFSVASNEEVEDYYDYQHDDDEDEEDEEECEEDGVYLSIGNLFIILNDMNIPRRVTLKKPEGLTHLTDKKLMLLESRLNTPIDLYHLTTFSEEEVQEKLKPVLSKLEDFEIKITHNNRICNELLVFCLNDLSNEENIKIISELVRGYILDVLVDLDLTYEFSYKEYVYPAGNTILGSNQRHYFVRKELDPKEVSLNTMEQLYSDYIKYTDDLRDFKRVYSMTTHDCCKYLTTLFGLEPSEYDYLDMYMDSCNEGIFFKRYFKDSEIPAEHCGFSKEKFFREILNDLPFR